MEVKQENPKIKIEPALIPFKMEPGQYPALIPFKIEQVDVCESKSSVVLPSIPRLRIKHEHQDVEEMLCEIPMDISEVQASELCVDVSELDRVIKNEYESSLSFTTRPVTGLNTQCDLPSLKSEDLDSFVQPCASMKLRELLVKSKKQEPTQQVKKKTYSVRQKNSSSTSRTRCSVDGCKSVVEQGLSFFRCPQEERRCQIWKRALGYTGTHRYAEISAGQCHVRIRICALHFEEKCFANEARSRLYPHAVPTLNIMATVPVEGESTQFNDFSVQTDFVRINDEIPVKAESSLLNTTSSSTQTSTKLLANTPQAERLRKQVNALKLENKNLQRRVELKPEVTMNDVLNFFEQNYPAESCKLLKSQILLLNKTPKGSRYSDEFKQFALSIHSLGPKAYQKFSTVFRLPSKSTLHRFTRKWIINPGFNDFVFGLIKCRVQLFKDIEKDCIICFDEMPLKSHLFYDISKDQIIGFDNSPNNSSMKIAGNALTIFARGIATSWKQPIAYFFCDSSTAHEDLKDILFETVRRLRKTGLNVLGAVSEPGSNFYKFATKTLNITKDNVSFFVDNAELVYIFDVPHLLKCTRNNFFTHIFQWEEGETRKAYLETMYNYEKLKQFKLAPKLSEEHIYPNNLKKGKVGLATQVFSHTVAVAMHTYIDFKILPEDARATANFIQKMNDVFDVLNSNDLQNFQAFTGSKKQKKILEDMDNFCENLQITDEKNTAKRLSCINGWRITLKAIQTLWKILQKKGHKYLFTRNLQQDCLESFFVQIRNCTGNTRNPTPIRYCRAFKKLFVLKYFDQAESANCTEDINAVLLNINPEFMNTCKEVLSIPTPKYTPLRVSTNDYTDLKSPEGNALVFVTGYLLKKSFTIHSCAVCKNSFGGLTTPSRDIVDFVVQLEHIFIKNFNDVATNKSVGTSLKNELCKVDFFYHCKDFPLHYFISLYTRVRIYFTLKSVNLDIKSLKVTKSKNKGSRPNIKLNILQNL